MFAFDEPNRSRVNESDVTPAAAVSCLQEKMEPVAQTCETQQDRGDSVHTHTHTETMFI